MLVRALFYFPFIQQRIESYSPWLDVDLSFYLTMHGGSLFWGLFQETIRVFEIIEQQSKKFFEQLVGNLFELFFNPLDNQQSNAGVWLLTTWMHILCDGGRE